MNFQKMKMGNSEICPVLEKIIILYKVLEIIIILYKLQNRQGKNRQELLEYNENIHPNGKLHIYKEE